MIELNKIFNLMIRYKFFQINESCYFKYPFWWYYSDSSYFSPSFSFLSPSRMNHLLVYPSLRISTYFLSLISSSLMLRSFSSTSYSISTYLSSIASLRSNHSQNGVDSSTNSMIIAIFPLHLQDTHTHNHAII